MIDKKLLGAVWLEFVQIESLDEKDLEGRPFVMRSLFLETLIDRAPFVIEELTTEVAPVYDQVCDEIRAEPRRYGRFLSAASPLYREGLGITIHPSDWKDGEEVVSSLGHHIEGWVTCPHLVVHPSAPVALVQYLVQVSLSILLSAMDGFRMDGLLAGFRISTLEYSDLPTIFSALRDIACHRLLLGRMEA